MLRLRVLASLVPLLALAAIAEAHFGAAPHPCIASRGIAYRLAQTPWQDALRVAVVDDETTPAVRVQLVDDPAAADFAFVDGNAPAEAGACEGAVATRWLTVAPADAADPDLRLRLTSDAAADYRIYVRSDQLSPQQAAALLIAVERGTPRLAQRF
jgi:hypothetical protein